MCRTRRRPVGRRRIGKWARRVCRQFWPGRIRSGRRWTRLRLAIVDVCGERLRRAAERGLDNGSTAVDLLLLLRFLTIPGPQGFAWGVRLPALWHHRWW